jgi:uncharacterized membrane protein HdeD (DUF308 family)
MSIATGSVTPIIAALQDLRRNWGWLLAWGICMIIVGTLAVLFACSATLASVWAFGILFLIGGGAHLVGAFWAKSWGGFFLEILGGILYIVIGVLTIEHPLAAAAGLTLAIAALLLVAGIFRIVVSIAQRFQGWVWVLLNGIVTLILGVLIWRKWPEDTLWVIGLFVGIDLIFSGWSWVMLALAARSLPKPAIEQSIL